MRNIAEDSKGFLSLTRNPRALKLAGEARGITGFRRTENTGYGFF
jgi:hypothetical protein